MEITEQAIRDYIQDDNLYTNAYMQDTKTKDVLLEMPREALEKHLTNIIECFYAEYTASDHHFLD